MGRDEREKQEEAITKDAKERGEKRNWKEKYERKEKEEKKDRKLKQELTQARIDVLNVRADALRAVTRALGLLAHKQQRKEEEDTEEDKD